MANQRSLTRHVSNIYEDPDAHPLPPPPPPPGATPYDVRTVHDYDIPLPPGDLPPPPLEFGYYPEDHYPPPTPNYQDPYAPAPPSHASSYQDLSLPPPTPNYQDPYAPSHAPSYQGPSVIPPPPSNSEFYPPDPIRNYELNRQSEFDFPAPPRQSYFNDLEANTEERSRRLSSQSTVSSQAFASNMHHQHFLGVAGSRQGSPVSHRSSKSSFHSSVSVGQGSPTSQRSSRRSSPSSQTRASNQFLSSGQQGGKCNLGR